MAKWIVCVTEEHVYHVTVEAGDQRSAMRAAETARESGRGVKKTRTPRRTIAWAIDLARKSL